MALTRRMLSALGIEADKIDEIINAHMETVNGLKDDLEKLKKLQNDADKLPGVQKELDDLKKSLEGKDYDALKKEYDDYKADVEKQKTRDAKEKAYIEVLKDANLNERGIERALNRVDWDTISVDESGKLVDAAKHKKAVQDYWSEYVTTTGQKGATTPTPPAGGDNRPGNNNTPSRAALVAQRHYEAIYGKQEATK